MSHIDAYIEFMKELDLLKSVLRTAWNSQGRPESTAEHSWRLALFTIVMMEEYPGLDTARVLTMALIHDVGEIYEGDISAAQYPDAQDKFRKEEAAVNRVFGLLPDKLRERFYSCWLEYEEGKTPEARLVKALDKAETIIQHNQGKNPDSFDYHFNLQYGGQYFPEEGPLRQLRDRLDQETLLHLLPVSEEEAAKVQNTENHLAGKHTPEVSGNAVSGYGQEDKSQTNNQTENIH